MSATIPNLNQLAQWLNADVYETTFRPIPLEEYIKIDSVLYNKQFQVVRQLNFSDQYNQGDNENLTEIIWNVIENNSRSVLVFCSTKHWCEVLAKLLAKNFRKIIQDKQINPFDELKLQDIIEQLRRTVSSIEKKLTKKEEVKILIVFSSPLVLIMILLVQYLWALLFIMLV